MNLKILAGLLTTSIFIVSCGTTINPGQENNNAKKQAVTDMAAATNINGTDLKFKLKFPAFKTKASADGYTINDIAYFLVNLSKSSTDPLAPNQLLFNTWQQVNINTPAASALNLVQEISYDFVIKNVTAGNVSPGATWYGVLRGFNSEGHELGIINQTLLGNSAGSRITVSENSVNIKRSNNKFYTDSTFTTEVAEPPVLDFNFSVQTGATIGSSLNVNPGSAPPDITVIENVPVVCFSCQ
jgi:hypothetical protein